MSSHRLLRGESAGRNGYESRVRRQALPLVLCASGGDQHDPERDEDGFAVYTAVTPRHDQGVALTPTRIVVRAAGCGELLVPADQLAGAPEQALATLVAYVEDPRRRTAIGTQAELERLAP
jgi:hypothetical protein